VIVEILLTGELESWIDSYGLRVTVVRPKDGATEEVLGGREWAYVVDLSSDTVVWKEFGSYSSSGESSAQTGLMELQNRLGQ
jgi:hypothetical protein